jgi:thioredoxin-related protein
MRGDNRIFTLLNEIPQPMHYITLLLALFIGNGQTPHQKAEEETTIAWMTMEEAIAANEQEPRKIFIDVYTDWCGWCKRMDAATFQHAQIAPYMNKHFYNVKFNAEQKDSIVFQGHTFKYVANGRRGYHELAAALLQSKMSYPTVVFLDEEFKMLSPVPGFQPPAAFEPIMTYFGDNAYKNTTWEEYQKNFKGEVAQEGK